MLESLSYSFFCTVLIACLVPIVFVIIVELKSVDSKVRKICLACIGSFLFVWFIIFLVCYIGGYYVC